jgi:hypothetical protein
MISACILQLTLSLQNLPVTQQEVIDELKKSVVISEVHGNKLSLELKLKDGQVDMMSSLYYAPFHIVYPAVESVYFWDSKAAVKKKVLGLVNQAIFPLFGQYLCSRRT